VIVTVLATLRLWTTRRIQTLIPISHHVSGRDPKQGNCGATSPYLDVNQQEWIPDTAPGIPNVYSVSGGEAVSMTSDDLQQEPPRMENVVVE
jgi:hypothetical protein